MSSAKATVDMSMALGTPGSQGRVRSSLRASVDLAMRPAVYRVRGRQYVSEKTLGMKRSPIRLPMVGRT